jgi:hypothetical protein
VTAVTAVTAVAAVAAMTAVTAVTAVTPVTASPSAFSGGAAAGGGVRFRAERRKSMKSVLP